MALAWTILGYVLLPIGLLLVVMIEPDRVLNWRRKNGPAKETATIVAASIWWGSVTQMLNSNSRPPALWSLLLSVACFGILLVGYVVMYRDPSRRSAHF